MNDTVAGVLIASAVSATFGFFLGVILVADMVTELREEAVLHGFAAFQVTDTLTGATEFQWRKP